MNHGFSPTSSSSSSPARGIRSVQIACAALLALGVGCGGGKAQKINAENTLGGDKTVTTTGEPEQLDTLIRARAVGSRDDLVHDTALEQLEIKLLGEGRRWLFERSGIPAWAPGVDLRMREDHTDGDVIITLGLSEERVAETLDALNAHPWRADAPEVLSAVLSRAMQAEVAAIVCERRQALLEDAACESPDMDVVRATVRSLSASVRVRPYFEGGQPVDRRGAILRPFSVVVETRSSTDWVPTGGVPIIARIPEVEEPLRGVSDPSGTVVLTPEGTPMIWPELGVVVTVDGERMLGGFDELWPETPVVISGRPVDRTRFTLVDRMSVRGKEVDDAIFADAVAEAVEDRATMVRIKDFVAGELAEASDATLKAELPDYATVWQGRIDTVVRVHVESDYASRMGAHRIWYEARAKVALFDVWTGQKLETFEETATASGVGEERADQAARQELARRLVERLFPTR